MGAYYILGALQAAADRILIGQHSSCHSAASLLGREMVR